MSAAGPSTPPAGREPHHREPTANKLPPGGAAPVVALSAAEFKRWLDRLEVEPEAAPPPLPSPDPTPDVVVSLREIQALPKANQPPPSIPAAPLSPDDEAVARIDRMNQRHDPPPQPGSATLPMPVVPAGAIRAPLPTPTLVTGRDAVVRALHNLDLFFARGRSTPHPTVASAPKAAETPPLVSNVPVFVNAVGQSMQAPMVALANDVSQACDTLPPPAEGPLTVSVSSRVFLAELCDPNHALEQHPHFVHIQYEQLPDEPSQPKRTKLSMGQHWGSIAKKEPRVVGAGDFVLEVTQDITTGDVLSIAFADGTTASFPQEAEKALVRLDGKTTLHEDAARVVYERVRALLPRIETAAALVRDHLNPS